MMAKRLVHELGFTAEDWAPCPFTIVTFIGYVEHATSYTWKPLQFSF